MNILLEILAVALFAVAVARTAPEPWRGRVLNVLKAYVTVRAFWLLLTHPVKMEDGSHVVAWRLILEQLEVRRVAIALRGRMRDTTQEHVIAIDDRRIVLSLL